MKRHFVWIVIILLALTACRQSQVENQERNQWELEKNETSYVNSNDKISIEFEAESQNSNGATLVIHNDSDEEISFGIYYFIQVDKDDEWFDISVPNDVSWPAILITLEAHDTYKQAVDWENMYGALPKGTYRLIKPYDIAGVSTYLTVEFKVP